MAPQAFSAPTLGATSKVIKKNEEVRRSRDSRFRSRTREVGSKENQEIGSAGSDDSGHFLSDGHSWIVSVLPHLEQQALYASFEPHFKGDFFSGGGMHSKRW